MNSGKGIPEWEQSRYTERDDREYAIKKNKVAFKTKRGVKKKKPTDKIERGKTNFPLKKEKASAHLKKKKGLMNRRVGKKKKWIVHYGAPKKGEKKKPPKKVKKNAIEGKTKSLGKRGGGGKLGGG